MGVFRGRFRNTGSRALPDCKQELARKGWWHSFDFPSGERVEGVRSIDELRLHLAQYPIPKDLSGKRVLDIGAWDGWFSFEMESRGAEVVAVDCWDNPKFRDAHRRLDSHVHYCVKDLYELTPREIGYFDIVLFFGVLYHLKHPLLALEKVCALSRDMACVESFVIDGDLPKKREFRRAIAEFYETDELNGQTDNWMAPNRSCLLAFCRTAGFARVREEGVIGKRACVTCYRKWDANDLHTSAPAPVLIKAIHNLDQGINFCSRRDEYVSCWFRTSERALDRQRVQPMVGGWGVMPLVVESSGEDVWQSNFKLPPGLEPGFHDARIRTSHSEFSNPIRIAVDVPLIAGALEITGYCDGRTWEPKIVRLSPDGVLSIWVRGLPENADLTNTEIVLADRRLMIQQISTPQQGQTVQINAAVPAGFQEGEHAITIRVGQKTSESVRVMIQLGMNDKTASLS